MKKIASILLVPVIAACAPQVTVKFKSTKTEMAFIEKTLTDYEGSTIEPGRYKDWYTITIPDPVIVPPPPPPPPPAPSYLFLDTFDGLDGLITNEYAFWNPSATDAVRSPDWEMTSGSLFRYGNQAWTGVPNVGNTGPKSTTYNNSAIFRMTSKRKDYGNVAVSFTLTNQGYVSTSQTPAVNWDGVHIFLRYQSEESLYYASVNRRDGNIVIKKKVPGGPSNGGTYYDLSNYALKPFTLNTPQQISATIRTNQDGSVTIAMYREGVLVLQATDAGLGGPPITNPGAVGIRGDNCNFTFDDFKVMGL